MTVYLNPNSSPRTFYTEKKFPDQQAYAPVADVKLECYQAVQRLLDSGAPLVTIKLAVQNRIQELHAGVVDGRT